MIIDQNNSLKYGKEKTFLFTDVAQYFYFTKATHEAG
jgi:hypothetical protein